MRWKDGSLNENKYEDNRLEGFDDRRNCFPDFNGFSPPGTAG